MITVPVVGFLASVSVIVGDEGKLPPLVGVVMEAIPEVGVVPPPGKLPTAVTVYVVSGVSPVTGQSLGLMHVTVIGLPPPMGVRVIV